MNNISLAQSHAISIVRVLAMFSIVACHILQGYGHIGAWILNIGVQVFFVMSGFLYGHKKILAWKDFYVKRIEKIYVPYIIFVIPIMICFQFLFNYDISFFKYITYILDIQSIIGGVFVALTIFGLCQPLPFVI